MLMRATLKLSCGKHEPCQQLHHIRVLARSGLREDGFFKSAISLGRRFL